MSSTFDLFSVLESLKESAQLQVRPLTSGQESALEILKGPENVFLTGIAGSGKSTLIQRYLGGQDRKEFPVLASTGAAAILIGGRTFHSYFGLGILQGGEDATIERALKDRRVVKRLKRTKAFVIDEVSMLSGATLTVAEKIAREARDSELPWGGMRVIAVGDFAQLPPVTQGAGILKDWAFRSPVWGVTRFQTVMLRETIRTLDAEFLSILNLVRDGKVTADVRDYLNERCLSTEEVEGFEGTRLFPRRDAVEKFNLERLGTLKSKEHRFETKYAGSEKSIMDLKRTAPIPEVLCLKTGALVMMRQNDPIQRWVNGSLGEIERIETEKLYIRLADSGYLAEIEPATFSILNAEGVEVASARNFPINLAYATTIHKSQGMTLDRVLLDLRNLWEPGQAYVALSRIRSGKGLSLLGWNPASIRVDPAVVSFYHR